MPVPQKLGTVLLYVLITTIGMQMNILAILGNPGLFIVGILWISFHALLLLIVGKIFKVPSSTSEWAVWPMWAG